MRRHPLLHLHQWPLADTLAAALTALALGLACGGQAQAAAPKLLSTACEEALALSAIPSHLRAAASTWVLGNDGYRRHRQGTGPISCLVQRNHPDSIIPVCFDAEGSRSIMPAKMAESEAAVAGASREQVKTAFAAGVARGDWQPPARPGLAWMVSGHNRILNQGRIIHASPHLMFYAPNLTDADIGGSFQAAMTNRGLPFVIDQGIHGYMVTFVDQPSDSSAVLEHCRGQIPDPWLVPHGQS